MRLGTIYRKEVLRMAAQKVASRSGNCDSRLEKAAMNMIDPPIRSTSPMRILTAAMKYAMAAWREDTRNE